MTNPARATVYCAGAADGEHPELPGPTVSDLSIPPSLLPYGLDPLILSTIGLESGGSPPNAVGGSRLQSACRELRLRSERHQ